MKFCEAMIQLGNEYSGTWTRCGRRPTELHHRLTRARGGLILDRAGEKYHLMNLCHQHHKDAHDLGTAIEAGLLLEGYVVTENGRPVYSGPDEYLSRRYGSDRVQESRG